MCLQSSGENGLRPVKVLCCLFLFDLIQFFFLTEELTQPRSQQKRGSLGSRLELKFWLRISYIVYEQDKTMIRVRGSYNKNLIVSLASLLPGFTDNDSPSINYGRFHVGGVFCCRRICVLKYQKIFA